ncbi:putative cyclin-dependent kinase inhibitor [Helianthus annuus]|nr:putative cyclin-dependent kinase inhibitor [Helianthus annuus]
MAPEAELEEFFVAAQEGLNERFKNKYNYDIVNDIPLKGRFEWIQVNPTNNKTMMTAKKMIRE